MATLVLGSLVLLGGVAAVFKLQDVVDFEALLQGSQSEGSNRSKSVVESPTLGAQGSSAGPDHQVSASPDHTPNHEHEEGTAADAVQVFLQRVSSITADGNHLFSLPMRRKGELPCGVRAIEIHGLTVEVHPGETSDADRLNGITSRCYVAIGARAARAYAQGEMFWFMGEVMGFDDPNGTPQWTKWYEAADGWTVLTSGCAGLAFALPTLDTDRGVLLPIVRLRSDNAWHVEFSAREPTEHNLPRLDNYLQEWFVRR